MQQTEDSKGDHFLILKGRTEKDTVFIIVELGISTELLTWQGFGKCIEAKRQPTREANFAKAKCSMAARQSD